MSDYVKTTDFAAKDALATGNPAKAAQGTEVDTEFNNIATAVATKYDSTDRNVSNGIAGLDAGALLLPAQLPQATLTALGGVELATTAEAAALTDADRPITPATLGEGIDAHNLTGNGLLGDLAGFTDPGADRLFGFDTSTNNLGEFTLGTGLLFSGSSIILDILGLEQLGQPGSDFLIGYDSGSLQSAYFTVTGGLEINGGNVQLANQSADANDPLSIASGSLAFDITGLTNIDIADTQPTDSLFINDGGANRQIDIQDMGTRVVNVAADQTFALGDANTMQLLTGTTDRTFDIPTDASVAFHIGTVIYLGSRDTATLTISPNTSAVTLTCARGEGVGPTAGDRIVNPGGMAALIKVAANQWMLTGDIE